MSDHDPQGRLAQLFDVVRRTITNFFRKQGMQWAGAVGFYLSLSIPPLLIAASSIAISIFGDDAAQEYITDAMTEFIPIEADLIEDIAEQTVGGIGPAALVSLAFLLFSGTRVFAALITAIHEMWDEVEHAGFVRMQVTRFVFLLGVGGLMALAGMLQLGVALAGDELPLDGFWVWLLESQVIPAVLLFLALLILFRIVPHREPTWVSALIGAAVGSIGLRIAQFGFTAFLATLGDFDTAYGPIAGIAALMTWALVASVTILLAAHLVAVLNRPDTPTGGDRNLADEDSRGFSQASK
jgi:membrane protein